MRQFITLTVAVLLTSIGVASRAGAREPLQTSPISTRTNSTSTASPRTLLVQSKTLFLVVPTKVDLQAEISKKLTAWGKLTLVQDLRAADLVLVVRQIDPLQAYSELRNAEGGGVQHTALVRHRHSGVEVWSTSKGGSWPKSDWNGAWAGREIADEFTKYFDAASRELQKPARKR